MECGFFLGTEKKTLSQSLGGDPFGALEWDALCAPTTTTMGVKEPGASRRLLAV